MVIVIASASDAISHLPGHCERERSNLPSRWSIASATLRSLHAVAGAPRNDRMPMGVRRGTQCLSDNGWTDVIASDATQSSGRGDCVSRKYHNPMTHTTQRPVIGVVGAWFSRAGAMPISGIGSPYLAAIEGAGGIPLLIHLTRDQEVLNAHYQRCDGLLFCGGGDIAPHHYGQAPHPKLGEVEDVRDEVELALARRAATDGMPLLGICRGVQLLNVALGGTLYQDIGAELPTAADHRESALRGERAYLAHPVALSDDSWLARILDTTEIAANTLHHQALRDIAPGLRVIGQAPDGVVEAVEGTGSTFIIGVQCHPEELWLRAEPRWARLFAGFVAHAAR